MNHPFRLVHDEYGACIIEGVQMITLAEAVQRLNDFHGYKLVETLYVMHKQRTLSLSEVVQRLNDTHNVPRISLAIPSSRVQHVFKWLQRYTDYTLSVQSENIVVTMAGPDAHTLEMYLLELATAHADDMCNVNFVLHLPGSWSVEIDNNPDYYDDPWQNLCNNIEDISMVLFDERSTDIYDHIPVAPFGRTLSELRRNLRQLIATDQLVECLEAVQRDPVCDLAAFGVEVVAFN
jgi:hypothetical protein